MYVRVVRFTDVDRERAEQLLARVNESGGPPPGVDSTGLRILFDDAQETAIVLQEFASSEAMARRAPTVESNTPPIHPIQPIHPTLPNS